MTYQEYIEASLSKFNLTESEVKIILVENNLTALEDVDVITAKKAIHNSLSLWLPLHSNLSEGGVSESWNFEAIKTYYDVLCTELGLENAIKKSNGTIRDKSNIW